MNLSKFLNERLKDYFSVEHVESINERITEHKAAISTLEAKRAEIVAKGSPKEQKQKELDGCWKFLTDAYKDRLKQNMGDEFDKGWLESCGFEQAVKTIDIPINELLIELKRRVKT